ncbi:MAG: Crp/Fnr family transcriptional regulator [Chthoniobacteraceae bacterium]
METLQDIIATHPFVQGVNPRWLHLFNECATLERVASQQPIFQESFEADRFFLIHRGQVVLQTFVPGRGMTTIQTLAAGEALGWSWLFPPHRWHFSAAALEPVEMVALCARTLRERMEENHEFGYALAIRIGQIMLHRLQATRMRLLEMYDVPG